MIISGLALRMRPNEEAIMSLEVTLTERTTWRRCEKDGNIFHWVGFYLLGRLAFLAWQCPRCKKLTLSEQLLKEVPTMNV